MRIPPFYERRNEPTLREPLAPNLAPLPQPGGTEASPALHRGNLRHQGLPR